MDVHSLREEEIVDVLAALMGERARLLEHSTEYGKQEAEKLLRIAQNIMIADVVTLVSRDRKFGA